MRSVTTPKMENSITRLRESLGELLRYYPSVLRNVFQSHCVSSTASEKQISRGEETDSLSYPRDTNHMADAVEGFLAELTRVLSIGLREGDGFELWSVLELLECVPKRMRAEAEAEASAVTGTTFDRFPIPPNRNAPSRRAASVPSAQQALVQGSPSVVSSTASRHSATPTHMSLTKTQVAAGSSRREAEESALWRHHLQRFYFASQLVYVVRSTFPAASHTLQARILLRLALNQGCLLAALELLRRWCRTELEGFYQSSDVQTQSLSTEGPKDQQSNSRGSSLTRPSTVRRNSKSNSTALLIQPVSDSDVWNSFVAAIAPVAGPPMIEIAAGAPKITAQPFHLQLLVAGLDDNSAASLEYYTQLRSFLRGRRATRPSALACYEAGQQRRARIEHTGEATEVVFPKPLSASSTAARDTAALSTAKWHTSAVPAQQWALQVESLPVFHAASRREDLNVDNEAGSGNVEAVSEGSGRSTCRPCPHRRKKKNGRATTAEGGGYATGKAEDELEDDMNVNGEGHDSIVEAASSITSHSPFPLTRRERSHCSWSTAAASPRNRAHRFHNRSASHRSTTIGEEASPKGKGRTGTVIPFSSNTLNKDSVRNENVEADVNLQRRQQRQESGKTFVRSDLSIATTTVFNEEAPSSVSRVSLDVRASNQHQQEISPDHDVTQSLKKNNAVGTATAIKAVTPLPPGLVDLQARVLLCWTMAVSHAESQERKRLSERDMDANDVVAM